MSEREPNLVTSSLSRRLTRDGISVEIGIYRLETEPGWSLEVVNAAGTSIVWDDLFPTDDAALAEFDRTVAEEGMVAFLDSGKVIPFRR
jgi:hypothetical protein